MKTKHSLHKIRSRVLAFALAGVFLLGCSGCTKTTKAEGTGSTEDAASGDAAMGRYMETQMDTPENFGGYGELKRFSDGTMVLKDRTGGTVNLSKDSGKTWETSETAKAGQKAVACGLTSLDYGEDGSLFYSYVDWSVSTDEKTYPEIYVFVSPDGTETEFELGLDDYGTSAVKSVVTKSGKIYVMTMDSAIYEVHPDAKTAEKLMTMEDYSTMNLIPMGDTIAATDGKKVYILDQDTGEFDTSDTVLNDYAAEACQYPDTMVFTEGADGKIYTASGSGIYAHSRNGNAMEQLAAGELTNLGDPSATPSDILETEDGEIIILYQDGSLYSYIYDPGVAAVPEKTLTIYSLYDNATARQAVSTYRKNHPEVYAKFEVGITGDDSVTANDAIQTLNTRLLAGEGPDLILMNGMPMDSYMEKGMLSDLTDFTAELTSENAYYENILKAYGTEKGLFALPIRFYLPYLSGTAEQMAGITDLTSMADMAEKTADSADTITTVFCGIDPEELISRLYPVCGGSWYDEDGSVDEEKIKDFLTQAKRIYDADYKNLDDDEKADLENNHMVSNNLEGTGFHSSAVSQSFQKLAKCQVMEAGFLTGMQNFEELMCTNSQMGNQEYKLWDGQQKKVFIAASTVGISAASKNQDMAKEFLKTLFGTEVQGKDLDDGFPVNKDAFESYSTNPYPEYYSCIGATDMEGNDVQLDLEWPTPGKLNELQELMESVETPSDTNALIEEEVVSIGEKALSGEKSIDECAKEISQKITLQSQE